jgi:parallel beta-helix repeat protein
MEGSSSVLEGFTIRGGSPGILCFQGASPTILNNTISDNSRRDGAGIYLHLKSSPAIVSNTITGNRATFHGGGILGIGTKSYIAGNRIEKNTGGFGGGMYFRGSSTPLIVGNIVADNQSTGIVFSNGSHGTIVNTTITRNLGFPGGVELIFGGSADVTNSILWGNDYGNLNTFVILNYSCTEGYFPGIGNTALNPRFLNPFFGDFRIGCDSPCIDSGKSSIGLGPTDFEGDARVIDGDSDGIARVDMGADEFATLFRFQGLARPGGTPVNFIAFSPPVEAGNRAIVAVSLGDGSDSGGIPVPGAAGRRIGLDPGPALSLWLSLPSDFRTVTLQGCSGAQTRSFRIPSTVPKGIEVFYAGISVDPLGNVVSITPTHSVITE